jgi:hypothetical protein
MEIYPKILVTRNNNSLTLILGNSHRTFNDNIDTIYAAALNYYTEYRQKSDKREEAYNILLEHINPLLRKEIAEVLTFDGKYYYLGKTQTKIPQQLASEIVQFSTEGYPIDSLVNFWKRCLLNPNEKARNDFFDYCKTFGITITSSGLAVLYKAVKPDYEKEDGLAEFVSKEYLKIKRWKKSPSNYFVHVTSTGHVLNEESLGAFGNLADLHNKIGEIAEEEGMKFKPWFAGGQFGQTIKLGQPVTMPREQCDSNINRECSYGLHIGSYEYVHNFANPGDIILACLVNPTDIVALPAYDTSKIRTCEYTPYAIIERDENGNWTEYESKFFETDEELSEVDYEFLNYDTLSLTESDIEEFRRTTIAPNRSVYEEELTDEDEDDYDEDWDDEDEDYNW